MNVFIPNIDLSSYLPRIHLPSRDRITQIANGCLDALSGLVHIYSRVIMSFALTISVLKIANMLCMPFVVNFIIIAALPTVFLIISFYLYIPLFTEKEMFLYSLENTLYFDFLAKWIVKINHLFGPNLNNCRTKRRETALIVAAKNDNLPFTRALLQHSNLNPNLSTYNNSILGGLERLRNLTRGIHPHTALTVAIDKEHFAVIEELIKSPTVDVNIGASGLVNNGGGVRSPLDLFITNCLASDRRAIARGEFTLTEQQFQIISLFAEYGADSRCIEIFNNDDQQFIYTVLIDAIKDGRKKARATELEGLDPFLKPLLGFKEASPIVRDWLEEMEFEGLRLKG